MRSIGGCRDCANRRAQFGCRKEVTLCGYKHKLVNTRRVCLSYRRKEE